MKVLLTGGTGFLGGVVLGRLVADGFLPTAVVRRELQPEYRMVQELVKFGFEDDVDWSGLVEGQEVIIHCAARAHIRANITKRAHEDLANYRRVNVDATLNLARQAAHAGVKRFIFVSSIGVNGASSTRPFTFGDMPGPVEPYAQSKWEAEQGLWRVQRETGIEVVIIRPPLIYGPGAPGNFGTLLRWVQMGIPLPLGAVKNKRSLVGVDNLVDLIIRCIDRPAAANQVFLAGDGEDLSTTQLLRGVAKAMGKPARLIPVPAGMLQFGATLIGKKAMAQRLLGSLQIDISKTCELLEWKPPYSVEEGLRRCFERFDH
jgi:nucleoside-diphosphate-sugar epimerase